MVEFVAPATGYPLEMITAGLFCVSFVGYPAAAAKNTGRWESNVFWLAMERSSLIVDYIILLIFLLITLIVSTLVAHWFIGADSNAFSLLAGLLWSTSIVFVWLRFWPMINISFIYDGYSRWSRVAEGNVWIGPGFGTAWQMTKQQDAFRRATIPLSLAVIVLVGCYCLIRFVADVEGGSLTVLNLFFYAFVLPFISTLADDLSLQCKVSATLDNDNDNGDDGMEDESEKPVVDRIESASNYPDPLPDPAPFVKGVEPLYEVVEYKISDRNVQLCDQCKHVIGKYWDNDQEGEFTKFWKPISIIFPMTVTQWTPRVYGCTRCEMFWTYRYDQYDRYCHFYPFPNQLVPYVTSDFSPQLIVTVLLHPDYQHYPLFNCFRDFLDRGAYKKQQAIDYFATAAMQNGNSFPCVVNLLELIDQVIRLASVVPKQDEPSSIEEKQLQDLSDEELLESIAELVSYAETNATTFETPTTQNLNAEHAIPLFTLLEQELLFAHMKPYERGLARKQLGAILNNFLFPSHRALALTMEQRVSCYVSQAYEYRVARYCRYFESLNNEFYEADFDKIESAIVEITPDDDDKNSFSVITSYEYVISELTESLRTKNLTRTLQRQSVGARTQLRGLNKKLTAYKKMRK